MSRRPKPLSPAQDGEEQQTRAQKSTASCPDRRPWADQIFHANIGSAPQEDGEHEARSDCGVGLERKHRTS